MSIFRNPLLEGRLFDPVSGIIGGGLSIVSGILGDRAAKKAGQIQSQADEAAANSVTQTAADVNPNIYSAAHQAGDQAIAGGQKVVDAAATGSADVKNSALSANKILDPYSQAGQQAAGTLQAGLKAGGDFNKTPTMSDIQIDPGYAFRLQQGQEALERSAAARGGAVSGSALKDLTNYSQGAASQEYQNAFNRYETSTQNRYQNLFGVSNLGAATGTTQGANLIGSNEFGAGLTTGAANTNLGANEYAGTAGINAADLTSKNTIDAANTAANYRTGGAAATAAGVVGGTNALTQGLSGAAQGFGGALNLSKLLKNPAVPSGGGTGLAYGDHD